MNMIEQNFQIDMSHLLIKGIDVQYLPAFMNQGELHFEPFSHFQTIKDGETGDPNEGIVAYTPQNSHVSIKFLDSQNEEIYEFDDPHAKLNYSYKNLQSLGLTSFYYVSPENGLNLKKFDPGNSITFDGINPNTRYTGTLNKRDLGEFKSFFESEQNKDKVPVLIPVQQLLNRILEKK
ncbi:hypothetical protein [Leuconostoc mesenteroides]|uniref:hypothetical protein n=1 Tax=Leuconostoc mesenteroides TaxID=1245 RepID=UPI0020786BC2|nr:hypothetical protein [Leuconostoc mesenteroides]USI45367.1 hypothetical protein M0D19_07680 [Leuconostoc mesenteroides]